MSVVAFARILSCCALVISSSAFAQPAGVATPAMTQPKVEQLPPSPSLCIDQIEVEPGFDDDPEFVVDRIDRGCTADTDPVSI